MISINSLPTTMDVSLSNTFQTYTISGDTIYSQTISFADLSNYFSTTDSFMELSAKYDELLSLMESFKQFIQTNYPDRNQLSSLLTTPQQLTDAIAELQTIDKTKSEILNEYATISYAQLKKAESYSYHERLASEMGSIRTAIVGSVEIPEENE